MLSFTRKASDVFEYAKHNLHRDVKPDGFAAAADSAIPEIDAIDVLVRDLANASLT